eukprot:TRINITY_DN6886_c0_g1_i3.p1 TRINITY_DN6886_c0_g1~~TRINITY_DN6886_c0_g1_i3.p1  ORF type:complete len:512 (+),score=112.50 TRINITY_DN6886_c0_g1_i3:65-1600(+)
MPVISTQTTHQTEPHESDSLDAVQQGTEPRLDQSHAADRPSRLRPDAMAQARSFAQHHTPSRRFLQYSQAHIDSYNLPHSGDGQDDFHRDPIKRDADSDSNSESESDSEESGDDGAHIGRSLPVGRPGQYFQVDVGAEMRKIFDDVRGKLPTLSSLTDDEEDDQEDDLHGGERTQTTLQDHNAKEKRRVDFTSHHTAISLDNTSDETQEEPSQENRDSSPKSPKAKDASDGSSGSGLYIYEPPATSLTLGPSSTLRAHSSSSPSSKSPSSRERPRSGPVTPKSPLSPQPQMDMEDPDDEVARINRPFTLPRLDQYEDYNRFIVGRPLVNFDSDSDEDDTQTGDGGHYEQDGDETEDIDPSRISISAASKPFASYIPTVVPRLDIDSFLGGVDLDELLSNLEKNPYIIEEAPIPSAIEPAAPSLLVEAKPTMLSSPKKETDLESNERKTPIAAAHSPKPMPQPKTRLSIHEQLRRDRCSQPQRQVVDGDEEDEEEDSPSSTESDDEDDEVDA